MKPDEYLEKLVAAAYKQEVDQDENIARSLPFFAAALAVLATVLGFVRDLLPPFELSAFAVVSYSCLAFIALAVGVVIWFLGDAVRPRRCAYLMDEIALRAYAKKLDEFYRGDEDALDGLEDAVVDDLRAAMIEQYAAGAMQNRANNAARVRARSYALSALVAALGFAFLLIGAILMQHIANKQGARNESKPIAAHQRCAEDRNDSRCEDGRDRLQADAAADAHGYEGRLVVARNHAEIRISRLQEIAPSAAALT
jgi:hypothetical protein